MSKENFETKLPVLETLPADQVRTPDLPVDVYLQEAENLSVIAIEDQEALSGAGLDWEGYGEDLPVRAGALRHAQSLWVKKPLYPARSPAGMEREVGKRLRRA